MKFLDRLGLVIFSIIILALSLILCFVISGWLDIAVIEGGLESLLISTTAAKISIVISVLLSLLALKCIFFNSFVKENQKSKEGILLENDNGKLLVSRDTIENLANNIIRNFPSAENVTTRVEVDSENNLSIFVTLSVYEDAIIKDLTAKIQKDVKEAIKKSIDLEIKSVNVRVKSLSVKKETEPKI